MGKSTLLESMALQLAGLPGVDLAAVDYGSGTFDSLEGALRWKLADSPELAIALFQELIRLYQERRERYKQADRARSLDQYNALTGDNLPFVVCFVDETSALLEHDGTKEPLIELARVGRKYGVGLILGGTDFQATTLPSKARSNCQARVAFWLESGLSRSLLNCEAATKLTDVGEIVVRKPGTVGLLQGRTPKVTTASYALLPHRAKRPHEVAPTKPEQSNGHKPDLDVVDDPDLPDTDRVILLHDAGASKRQIAMRVFGYSGGAAYGKVDAALSRSSITAKGDDDGTGAGAVLDGKDDTTTTENVCEFCGTPVDEGEVCAACDVYCCESCATSNGVCPDCLTLQERAYSE